MFNSFWVIGQKKVISIGVGLNELHFKVPEQINLKEKRKIRIVIKKDYSSID